MARPILILVIGLALSLAVAGSSFGVEVVEDSWVSKAPMREGRTGVGLSVVNGKIYAIGGANQDGFRATNEEYDPGTNTWTFKAPMPTPRSAFGIAVYQNKIYCIGGYIPGGATGTTEVYDPARNTWETEAPMPTPELNLQASAVNDRIYLIGGSPNGTLNQVYDPEKDAWSIAASAPTAVSSYASAVFNDKIYLTTSNLTQIYDTENNSWTLGTPAPLPAILGSAAATTGVNSAKRIYLFGADADLPFWQLTTRKFTAQSYDPENDTWMVCTPLPTGRFDASAAVVGDQAYLIGGFTLEFPSDKLTLNAKYTYSASNDQYTPIGYGCPESTPSEKPGSFAASATDFVASQDISVLAIAIATVVFTSGSLLVYFKKRKH